MFTVRVKNQRGLLFKFAANFCLSRRSVLGCAIILSAICSSTSSSVAANGELKTLRGHVPDATRHLRPKGVLATDGQLRLALGVPLTDEAGLEDFLQRIYNPKDPSYRQFLTPEEFTKRFGPAADAYEKIIAFAQRNHLTVTARHSNRLVLDVSGSVADVQRAFHTTLHVFKHPNEQRDFFAPDIEPSVESELPLADISGLNNYVLPHPRSVRMAETSSNPAPRSGSGAGGAYLGNDFRAAYLPEVTLTGAGQILGLVQFDGFYSADIDAYEKSAGLPQVPLQTILLDGYDGVPTSGSNSGNGEVSLDIEMAVCMAPGLSKIVLFEAGPNGFQNDILSAMASHAEIKQLSCSWGWGGGPNTTTDNLFKQMAAQGQSFFCASGDSDAFATGAVDDPNQVNSPSSCPYITVVGGVTLTTSGPGGAWASEAVWNRGNGVGSSGGVSSHYAIPSWQAGIDMTANGGSTGFRNTPDVAFVAENVFVQYGNGTSAAFGGTSCAAPLWAGLAALMNQQASNAGKPALGFINPAIYALGKSQSYNSLFHDVTTGDNSWSGSPNAFSAGTGYDLCTGWGTPTGQSLIDALAGPRDALGIVPTPTSTIAGPQGGPFVPDSLELVLTNSGQKPLTWSLISTSAWMQASASSGELFANVTVKVGLALTAAAALLPEGSYTAALAFSNELSHLTVGTTLSLQVGQSIVKNGGFETSDFTDWTLTGHSVLNSSGTGPSVYNAVEANSSGYQVAHSGGYGAFLGDTQLATLSQNLATIPGQNYLLSLWFNNPTSGLGQRFLVNWTASGSPTQTVFSINNPGVVGWTNLQLVVTATQKYTTLEVGAENDSAGFGVDDISVKPLPSLTFSSITKGVNGYNLSWRSSSWVKYQLQSTSDLANGNWLNVGPAVAGNDQTITAPDPNPIGAGATRFYRLVLTH